MNWYLRAQAWTKDLLTTSVSRYFTASKPLVVSSIHPQHIHPGETFNLISSVSNTTGSNMVASVRISVEDGTAVIKETNTDITLAPGETRSITTPFTANINGGTLAYTIRASNGVYSDGERHGIPVTSD